MPKMLTHMNFNQMCTILNFSDKNASVPTIENPLHFTLLFSSSSSTELPNKITQNILNLINFSQETKFDLIYQLYFRVSIF